MTKRWCNVYLTGLPHWEKLFGSPTDVPELIQVGLQEAAYFRVSETFDVTVRDDLQPAGWRNQPGAYVVVIAGKVVRVGNSTGSLFRRMKSYRSISTSLQRRHDPASIKIQNHRALAWEAKAWHEVAHTYGKGIGSFCGIPAPADMVKDLQTNLRRKFGLAELNGRCILNRSTR
jgi:hypothetical protein